MYRAVVYVNLLGDPTRATRFQSNPVASEPEADDLLNRMVGSGVATGGHIEVNIDGFGWCLDTPSGDD